MKQTRHYPFIFPESGSSERSLFYIQMGLFTFALLSSFSTLTLFHNNRGNSTRKILFCKKNYDIIKTLIDGEQTLHNNASFDLFLYTETRFFLI